MWPLLVAAAVVSTLIVGNAFWRLLERICPTDQEVAGRPEAAREGDEPRGDPEGPQRA